MNVKVDDKTMTQTLLMFVALASAQQQCTITPTNKKEKNSGGSSWCDFFSKQK
jgi:hypothetical protein